MRIKEVFFANEMRCVKYEGKIAVEHTTTLNFFRQ